MNGRQQPLGTGQDIDPEHLIMTAFAAVIITVGLSVLIWYNFHAQISAMFLYLADIELRGAALFTHRYDQILINIAHAQPKKMSARTLWGLCTITGQVILFPALGLFALLATICIHKAPRAIYRKKFDLIGMTKMLATIHPIGKAWVGGNPKLTPPATTAQSLRPMDPVLTPGEWRLRYAPGPTNKMETIQKAHSALTEQLGSRWSMSDLTPVELCLFMAFSLYYMRQKDQAQQLLEDLSAALSGKWKNGEIQRFIQLDKSFHQKMLKTYKAGTWTKSLEIVSRHAYVRPALMSLLQEARRKSGVVNPSLFSVVQLVDRSLWLILCALPYPMPGRPIHAIVTTSCTEAEGAMEHWRAECISRKPLSEPQLQLTLTTLMTIETNKDHDN